MLTGVVKTWNPVDWTGTVESNGKSYIVRRNSFKRGTKLASGMVVSFTYSNLSHGPTVLNLEIVPVVQK